MTNQILTSLAVTLALALGFPALPVEAVEPEAAPLGRIITGATPDAGTSEKRAPETDRVHPYFSGDRVATQSSGNALLSLSDGAIMLSPDGSMRVYTESGSHRIVLERGAVRLRFAGSARFEVLTAAGLRVRPAVAGPRASGAEIEAAIATDEGGAAVVVSRSGALEATDFAGSPARHVAPGETHIFGAGAVSAAPSDEEDALLRWLQANAAWLPEATFGGAVFYGTYDFVRDHGDDAPAASPIE